MKHKKLKSILAFCLAIIVLITGIVTFSKFTEPVSGDNHIFTSIDEADRVKINQIASTTGAKVDHITKLRQKGKSWNEIIDTVKTGNYENEIDTADYKTLLKLEDQKEVETVQLITNRVEFSLHEINAKKQLVEDVEPVIDDPLAEKDKDDIEEYYKLSELFENDKVTYLAIHLKQEYGTYESVIDEYLYCLQIDVDLADLLQDRDEFNKQVQEKGALTSKVDAITIQKIEFKMLEVIKNNTTAEEEKEQGNTDDLIKPAAPPQNIDKNPIAPPDVMPKNPQNEVQNEIEAIKAKGSV